MNPLLRLQELGQSVWYDNIQRSMLTNGELARMISEDGLRGMTSNPTIFEKAINGSQEYDSALISLIQGGHGGDAREIFFDLAIDDIQAAADVFRPVHEQTNVDGMVSLEVSPDLAYDTEATIAEAHRLWARVSRPNCMIKVPATREGLPAIRTLIAEGININVTLLFSLARYREVVEAYLAGLEARLQRGLRVDQVTSVASFFVSRVDTAVDAWLEERAREASPADAETYRSLQGKIAIANAKLAYHWHLEITQSSRFARLREAGAHPQRLLWASTGTKNPHYRDVLYVESLIGPDTVNTMPPATYNAFRDHGIVAPTLMEGLSQARTDMDRLGAAGLDLAAVTDRLEQEGVQSFAASFHTLLTAIEHKVQTLRVSEAARVAG